VGGLPTDEQERLIESCRLLLEERREHPFPPDG
jgi:hypothetical protein